MSVVEEQAATLDLADDGGDQRLTPPALQHLVAEQPDEVLVAQRGEIRGSNRRTEHASDGTQGV